MAGYRSPPTVQRPPKGVVSQGLVVKRQFRPLTAVTSPEALPRAHTNGRGGPGACVYSMAPPLVPVSRRHLATDRISNQSLATTSRRGLPATAKSHRRCGQPSPKRFQGTPRLDSAHQVVASRPSPQCQWHHLPSYRGISRVSVNQESSRVSRGNFGILDLNHGRRERRDRRSGANCSVPPLAAGNNQ